MRTIVNLYNKSLGVKKNVYLKIVRAVLKRVVEYITTGNLVKINNIGMFYVATRKTWFIKEGHIPNVDYFRTRQLWDKYPEKRGKDFIYHLNSHTDGKFFKVKWSWKKVGTKFKALYKYHTTWSTRQHLTKAIKAGTEFPIYENN